MNICSLTAWWNCSADMLNNWHIHCIFSCKNMSILDFSNFSTIITFFQQIEKIFHLIIYENVRHSFWEILRRTGASDVWYMFYDEKIVFPQPCGLYLMSPSFSLSHYIYNDCVVDSSVGHAKNFLKTPTLAKLAKLNLHNPTYFKFNHMW